MNHRPHCDEHISVFPEYAAFVFVKKGLLGALGENKKPFSLLRKRLWLVTIIYRRLLLKLDVVFLNFFGAFGNICELATNSFNLGQHLNKDYSSCN